MPILLALAAAAASPQPGELKTFKDWTVGCDNARACKAVGLMPEDAPDRDDFLRLALLRDGAANAQPVLTVDAEAIKPGVKMVLMLDGRPFAELMGASGEAEPTLTLTTAQARALANGTTASVGKATAPLSGLSAALRYIDDRQRRAGTVTALVVSGPARAVPPLPAVPVVAMPPVTASPPARFRAADVRKYNGDDGCGVARENFKPEAFRLDATHTLVMVPAIGGNGAYNYFSTALIAPNKGAPLVPAKFDVPSSMGEPGNIDPSLVNASYDPKTRRLSTYAKGRGLGDCGVVQEFAWDDSRFRLVEQAEMGECRGSVDYIRT